MTATQRAGIALFALWVHGAMAQPFIQPVDAPCILSPFGPRYISNHPVASGLHRGLDFPVPQGAPVWATAAGTGPKVQNRWPGGLGRIIKHNGFVSIYSHLGSVSNRIIRGKTPVAAGELVGYVGHTGFFLARTSISALCMMGSPSIRHKCSACRVVKRGHLHQIPGQSIANEMATPRLSSRRGDDPLFISVDKADCGTHGAG